jgi:hypothetical protein
MTNLSEIKPGTSDVHSLQHELEQKSRLFDQLIDLDADCEKARILYIEIRELRFRMQEISPQNGGDLFK